MPTGVVMWFDDVTGEGRLRRNGREYPVNSSDIEPAARVPLARVHFDIKRQQGIQRAVNVTLRRGRRMAPHQHRFGDLGGAHHPDEKGHHPLTDNRPGTDWSFEGHPVQLIEEWTSLVGRREFSTVRLLYAPEAVLHLGSEQVSGRDAIIERMREVFAGAAPKGDAVHERDGVVSVELSVADRTVRFAFRVAHGRIAEQWI